MRSLLTTTALLLFSSCLLAQEPAKPNNLTPKEIAEGWILLFDGETTFGWDVNSAGKVKNGTTEVNETIKSTTHFPSYEVKYQFRPEGKENWTSVSHEAKGPLTIQDQRKGTLIRDIKLKPLDMKPLFNGKDLTGWKIFPDKKSKFEVVDGAINIKDGPGDLQTEGKYGDFLLQLECKSNGKHLNSGVFFRCREGEYQNGYEAQIRNQFTAEPTQEYVIEKYDPKTKMLIGKEKIKSTAFDYGTGAIYRRMPARKEMAKDGEWFTLTIVAHGNHFATWVNGIQVVDWTDHRPKSDNARTGCRLEPGHISFQGHDPTTDLSFRNIRIAEIK